MARVAQVADQRKAVLVVALQLGGREDARQHARKFEFLLTRPKSAHCRLAQLPDLNAEQRADAFAVSADVLDAWDALLRMQ